jgi:sugar lactone lactonase YvrE
VDKVWLLLVSCSIQIHCMTVSGGQPRACVQPVLQETKQVTVLTSHESGEDGVPLRFIDDVAVASDGKIYFSVTSKLGPALEEDGMACCGSDLFYWRVCVKPAHWFMPSF